MPYQQVRNRKVHGSQDPSVMCWPVKVDTTKNSGNSQNDGYRSNLVNNSQSHTSERDRQQTATMYGQYSEAQREQRLRMVEMTRIEYPYSYC